MGVHTLVLVGHTGTLVVYIHLLEDRIPCLVDHIRLLVVQTEMVACMRFEETNHFFVGHIRLLVVQTEMVACMRFEGTNHFLVGHILSVVSGQNCHYHALL